MARYCFYCGRELTAGERCQCKTPASDGEKRSEGSSGQANAEKDADRQGSKKSTRTSGSATDTPPGEKSHASSKTRHARAPWNRKSNKTAQNIFERAGRFQQRRFSRLVTFKDQVRTLFPTFTHAFASGAQYFLRPVSKIRQESLRSKRSLSYVYIILFSLLTGLLGLMMSRSGAPLYTNVLSVVMGSGLSLVYAHPGYAFAAISAFIFLFSMALSGTFYVAARFSNRKPTFRKVVDLVSLSLVYPFAMEVFLLITILIGSRGSVSLLLVSFLLMSITHFLSFRSALGLSEDAVFFFLLFVYFVSYLIITFLLYAFVRLLVTI